MPVVGQTDSNPPTGSAWLGQPVGALPLLVGMALQLAAAQLSRDAVPWSGFHIPDSALAIDTHDNRAALLHRADVSCHHALGGVLLHKAGALQDSATCHPVAARRRWQRTFLLGGSAQNRQARREQERMGRR